MPESDSALCCCRYGFRTPPHLELKARPKLGEREVTLAHVTDWIERKLDQEFQVGDVRQTVRIQKSFPGVSRQGLIFRPPFFPL